MTATLSLRACLAALRRSARSIVFGLNDRPYLLRWLPDAAGFEAPPGCHLIPEDDGPGAFLLEPSPFSGAPG